MDFSDFYSWFPLWSAKFSNITTPTVNTSTPGLAANTTVPEIYCPFDTETCRQLQHILGANIYTVLLSFGYMLAIMLGVIGIFYLTYKRRIDADEAYEIEETQKTAYKRAWKTDKWAAAIGMIELWLMGKISWGPWDGESIRERTLDKKQMKRLWRAGIIPLRIQYGGVRTYRKNALKIRGLFDITLPIYVQSKQRAEFVFVMPQVRNAAAQKDVTLRNRRYDAFSYDPARYRFLDLLLGDKGQEQYAVDASYWHSVHERDAYDLPQISRIPPAPDHYPLECGGTSPFKYLLPFVSDRILMRGKGNDNYVPRLDYYVRNPVVEFPLLALQSHAVVRIEAFDYLPHRLDTWVHEIAQKAGMGDIWPEDELSRAVGGVLEETGLYVQEQW